MNRNRKYDINSEEDFKSLFNEYYPSMFHYCKSIVDDADAAEDIVQDVFLRLWNKRKELEINSFSGFLYTSVRYACMNYLRAEKRRRLKNKQLEAIESEEIEDRLILIEEEMVRQIKKLIDELPEQRQKVFKLHIEGLSQQEISEYLGVSINTVKTHKLKARQFLKEKLKNSLYILLLVKF